MEVNCLEWGEEWKNINGKFEMNNEILFKKLKKENYFFFYFCVNGRWKRFFFF